MRRRRRRGSDGWELVADFARVIKALGVLGGRERRQALFQTSPLIYLKLESCRANDGATTILRLPPVLPSVALFCGPTPSPVTPIYLTLARISDVMTSKENSTWEKIPSSFHDISCKAS